MAEDYIKKVIVTGSKRIERRTYFNGSIQEMDQNTGKAVRHLSCEKQPITENQFNNSYKGTIPEIILLQLKESEKDSISYENICQATGLSRKTILGTLRGELRDVCCLELNGTVYLKKD